MSTFGFRIRPLGWLVSIAVVAGMFAPARSAMACQEWCPNVVYYGPGAPVPPNAVAFVISGPDQAQPRLIDAAGTEIPSTLTPMEAYLALLRPQAPLAPDSSFNVVYYYSCNGGELAQGMFAFQTATSELTSYPTETGTLTVQPQKTIDGYLPASRIQVDVVLAPSPSLLATGGLARTWTQIDGASASPLIMADDGRTVSVEATCDPAENQSEIDSCGLPTRFSTGTHTVTIGAYVLGAAVQPAPVSTSVQLDCPQASGNASGCAMAPSPRSDLAGFGVVFMALLILGVRIERTSNRAARRTSSLVIVSSLRPEAQPGILPTKHLRPDAPHTPPAVHPVFPYATLERAPPPDEPR